MFRESGLGADKQTDKVLKLTPDGHMSIIIYDRSILFGSYNKQISKTFTQGLNNVGEFQNYN